MRCLLVGHLVRDVVRRGSKSESRIGGGVYYSGVALSRFCDVEILSSVGEDFPDDWLSHLEDMGIRLRLLPSTETTSYELRYSDGNSRELRLLSRAAPITDVPAGRYDMVLLNPVAGEIPPAMVERLKGNSNFIAADVQGFVREPLPGKLRTREIDASFLRGIEILHGDGSEIGLLRAFEPAYVTALLSTDGPGAGVCYFRGRRYLYRPVRVNVGESTGAGDVFLAVFSYFYMNYPFVEALKLAGAFTALFLERRSVDFSMGEVRELAGLVGVERTQGI